MCLEEYHLVLLAKTRRFLADLNLACNFAEEVLT